MLPVIDTIYFYADYLKSLCCFCNAKTIVEIGVQHGNTTLKLCEAAKFTNGCVYGYDYFEPIGAYGDMGLNKENIENLLKSKYNSSLFKITKTNTFLDSFSELLKTDTSGSIDFAFIDGCHSYNGITNDFLKVYPLLSETGIIAFHDTYSHTGCRLFVIDLYTKYNDGTFDVINLPFGGGRERYGLTILVKRSYPLYKAGIIYENHDLNIKKEDVYNIERNWYEKKN